MVTSAYAVQLEALLMANGRILSILQAARAANLPQWYVGAGLIRNVVWDSLHGYTSPTPTPDIDVAFFDPDDLSPERDEAATAVLKAQLPSEVWEATNQAAVHTWHEAYFGYPIEPYQSAEEGIAGWPETATSIGIRLLPDESLHIFAPCGLEDLFGLRYRRNRRTVTVAQFRHRFASKEIAKKWPRVTFIDG